MSVLECSDKFLVPFIAAIAAIRPFYHISPTGEEWGRQPENRLARAGAFQGLWC